MTRIRTTCPQCGEVEIGVDDVALHVGVQSVGGGWYGFTCPGCAMSVRKPADARVAQLLIGGGVSVVSDEPDTAAALFQTPVAAATHPERPRGGPAFTYNDLLDFHLLLEDDAWFLELLSVTR